MPEQLPIDKTVRVINLGKMDYQEAWDLQESLLKKGMDQKKLNRHHPEEAIAIPNYILLVEHPHVYTLGKSGKPEHLLLNESQLSEQGISWYKINRGGDITYHGPGQLVGYPILDLENFKPDLHLYLRNLEEACILTMADYGLGADRIDGLTGAWLGTETEDPRKVMAIGIRCARWITMHGFALNVNTDLSLFENIIPCGIEDKGVTSLSAELGRHIPLAEVQAGMLRHLSELFGFDSLIQLEKSDLLQSVAEPLPGH